MKTTRSPLSVRLNSGTGVRRAARAVNGHGEGEGEGEGRYALKNWSLIYPGDGDAPALAPIRLPMTWLCRQGAGGCSRRRCSLAGRHSPTARLSEPALLNAIAETAQGIDARVGLPERDAVLERIDTHVKTLVLILIG